MTAPKKKATLRAGGRFAALRAELARRGAPTSTRGRPTAAQVAARAAANDHDADD